MGNIYRKSLLEKISSPEQLDKSLVITSPMSWLVLIGITLITIVTIVWSVVGTIPVTVSTQGIISSPVNTNAVYTEESGTVLSVLVTSGSEVHLGDAILKYRTVGSEVKTVYCDQVGIVSEVLVSIGDSITQGNEVVRISPTVTGSQVAVCYIPVNNAKKIERGMKTQIYLDSVDSQSYGHMVARVVNIDKYVTSNKGMGCVLGTDNNMISMFQQDGAVVAVTCEFYPEDTVSGYYWSNEKGNSVSVTNGSTIRAKIITEEVAPITKLFSKLGEIWGN